jgi:hypothetical protein
MSLGSIQLAVNSACRSANLFLAGWQTNLVFSFANLFF